ncbi:MAG TPA: hypothetical protein PK275_09350 [Chitinophagaceae bacterium]|nr:hypothetical protein [Chitinophagaceae bacterium]
MSLIFSAASCETRKDKPISSNSKSDTLPLPANNTTFYFETKLDRQDTINNTVDSFLNSWFSKILFSLQEPVLKDYKGDKEVYRFTWLRTFNHPVVVRLEKQGKIVKAFSKVSDGAGGYEPEGIIFDTTFSLTQKQINTINFKLGIEKFLDRQTELRTVGEYGSKWIIEVYKEQKYHVVIRWTPEKGTFFRAIGEYLFSISQIENEMKGRNNGDY